MQPLLCSTNSRLCQMHNTPSIDNGIFVCTPGVNIPLDQLCDGVNDCANGDDETNTLCESELIY